MPPASDFTFWEYAGVSNLLSTLDAVQLARLLEVLVVDLYKQPHVCEEELEPLPESLTAAVEDENEIAREAFGPVLEKELEVMSTTCQIHSKIGRRLLCDIDRYLHREANCPPDRMTGTYHVPILFILQGVFDKETTSDDKETSDDNRLDRIKVELHSNCAGCRIRRILSDRLLLGTLLVAARLRPCPFTDFLEAAWFRLGSHIMGLSDIDVARYAFDSRAEAASLGADEMILFKGPGFCKLNMMSPMAVGLHANSHMICRLDSRWCENSWQNSFE
jgi:hypothetical protein